MNINKIKDKKRILQGERSAFTLQSEKEEYDGGYTDIKWFKEGKEYICNMVRKRRNRKSKPKCEKFRPDKVAGGERERREKYLQQQQQLAREAEVLALSSS